MKIQNLRQKKNGLSKGVYSQENPIKFLTSSLESSLRDCSDAYVLVTGNIAVTGGDANTKVVFKNCPPFRKCRTEINGTFIDEAQHINTAMPMYNLITVIIIVILQEVYGSLKEME